MAKRPDEIDPYVKRILEEGPPITVEGPGGLTERIGVLFHCMTGPPRRYFEYPGATIKAGEEYPTVQHAYDMLWYAVRENDVPMDPTIAPHRQMVELLVARLWEDFKWAYELLASAGFAGPQVLFWRAVPTLGERGADFETGDTGSALKLYCRLAVPGVEFPSAKSEGALGHYLTEEEIATLRLKLHPPAPPA